MEGDKVTRLDRLDKTGGGVCVYTRAILKVKRFKDITDIPAVARAHTVESP